jgi:uncharacterized lipoprotein YbaY
MTRRTVFACALTAAVGLAGCSSSSTDVLAPTVSVSIGQQLIDLKNARDAGAISEQEYQAQARRVIDAVK